MSFTPQDIAGLWVPFLHLFASHRIDTGNWLVVEVLTELCMMLSSTCCLIGLTRIQATIEKSQIMTNDDLWSLISSYFQIYPMSLLMFLDVAKNSSSCIHFFWSKSNEPSPRLGLTNQPGSSLVGLEKKGLGMVPTWRRVTQWPHLPEKAALRSAEKPEQLDHIPSNCTWSSFGGCYCMGF